MAQLGREPINGLYSDQRNDVRSRANGGLRLRRLPCRRSAMSRRSLPNSAHRHHSRNGHAGGHRRVADGATQTTIGLRGQEASVTFPLVARLCASCFPGKQFTPPDHPIALWSGRDEQRVAQCQVPWTRLRLAGLHGSCRWWGQTTTLAPASILPLILAAGSPLR
jgi:hypothetical protein